MKGSRPVPYGLPIVATVAFLTTPVLAAPTSGTAARPPATASARPAPAAPRPAPAVTYPGPPACPGCVAGVRTLQLANGLRVALAADTFATTVDLALWFPAGTRYERATEAGLTHLFDGLLFAGTERHPAGDHQRLVQHLGGSATAFSTTDFAAAEDNVPPDGLGLALALEADRMANLRFGSREFDAARAAVRREHEVSQENSPLGQSLRRLYGAAFPNHPYRRPAAGTDADLDHLTLPVAQAWWRDHYGPAGTWLTLAGRFDPDSAERLVRRTLGAVPRRGTERAAAAPPVVPITERHATGKLDGALPVLVVGWQTPSQTSADAAALEVLGHLLARGTHSRIERALVTDSSSCLAVSAGLDLRRDAGLFYVAAAIRPDADSARAEAELLDAMDRLAAAPIDAEDLAGALDRTELEAYLGWQSSQGLARSLGVSASLGGRPDGDARRLERTHQLSPRAVHDVAQRALAATHRTVVWMRPAAVTAPAGPPPSPRPPGHHSAPAGPGKGRP
jgi:zinc protease